MLQSLGWRLYDLGVYMVAMGWVMHENLEKEKNK